MSQFQINMSKKAGCILLSLASLFSFVLVSYSSVFLPLLSTISINLFSYSIDRHYIFLLFNGILVFLLRNSSFNTNSSLVTDHIKKDHVTKTFTDNSSPVDHIKSNQVEKSLIGDSSSVSYQIKNTRVEETREINLQVPMSSRVNPEVHTQQAEEEERQIKTNEVLFSIADSESEEKTGQVLDTQDDENENYVDEDDEEREELNKRCEEFIRRVKQDIQTQPTRKLARIN